MVPGSGSLVSSQGEREVHGPLEYKPQVLGCGRNSEMVALRDLRQQGGLPGGKYILVGKDANCSAVYEKSCLNFDLFFPIKYGKIIWTVMIIYVIILCI